MQIGWGSSKVTLEASSSSLRNLFELLLELLNIFLVSILRHYVSDKLFVNANVAHSHADYSAVEVYWHKSTIAVI